MTVSKSIYSGTRVMTNITPTWLDYVPWQPLKASEYQLRTFSFYHDHLSPSSSKSLQELGLNTLLPSLLIAVAWLIQHLRSDRRHWDEPLAQNNTRQMAMGSWSAGWLSKRWLLQDQEAATVRCDGDNGNSQQELGTFVALVDCIREAIVLGYDIGGAGGEIRKRRAWDGQDKRAGRHNSDGAWRSGFCCMLSDPPRASSIFCRHEAWRSDLSSSPHWLEISLLSPLQATGGYHWDKRFSPHRPLLLPVPDPRIRRCHGSLVTLPAVHRKFANRPMLHLSWPVVCEVFHCSSKACIRWIQKLQTVKTAALGRPDSRCTLQTPNPSSFTIQITTPSNSKRHLASYKEESFG